MTDSGRVGCEHCDGHCWEGECEPAARLLVNGGVVSVGNGNTQK